MSNVFLYGRTGWLALNVPLPSAQFDKAASLACDLTLRMSKNHGISSHLGGLEIPKDHPAKNRFVHVPLFLEGPNADSQGSDFGKQD